MKFKIATVAAASAALVALAAPPASADFGWIWTDCTPGDEHVESEITNESNTQTRLYRVRYRFFNSSDVLLRETVIYRNIGPNASKNARSAFQAGDAYVKTQHSRGHWEYPGGWQTYVVDQVFGSVGDELEAC